MDQEKVDKIIEVVAKQLELENGISKKFVAEALHAIKTFDSKHTEKGLSRLDKFGAIGVIIKTDEKYSELLDLTKNNLEEEKVRRLELWGDIAVYSLIGKIVENDKWS